MECIRAETGWEEESGKGDWLKRVIEELMVLQTQLSIEADGGIGRLISAVPAVCCTLESVFDSILIAFSLKMLSFAEYFSSVGGVEWFFSRRIGSIGPML